ncbi:MAG: hypothetical protein WCS96_02075 [Victivallales bacterium]
MIKKLIALCLTASLFIVVGCASVQTAQKLNDQKLTTGGEVSIGNVNASNWGLYLLWIPVLTGDTDKVGSIAFVKDTVNTESVVAVATKKAKDMGATKSVDLNTSTSSIWIMPLFVVFFKSVQVSTNAVK